MSAVSAFDSEPWGHSSNAFQLTVICSQSRNTHLIIQAPIIWCSIYSFISSPFSGMLLIDKNKPSIMKWRGKNEHYTCNYTLAGVQGTTMRNKAKRRREKEINRKVTELLNSGRCQAATSLASMAIRNLIWSLVPFTPKISLVSLLLSAKQFFKL